MAALGNVSLTHQSAAAYAVRQVITLAAPIALLVAAVFTLGGGLGEQASRPAVSKTMPSAAVEAPNVYYLVPPSGAPALDTAEWMAGGALDNIIVISRPDQEASVLRALERGNSELLARGAPGIVVVNLLNP